jgi:predicted membrane-bound spermidine synthase
MRSRSHLLTVLVFVAGMTTMAVEMASARLLAPWFGDSLPIWASLIGLVLVYLSAGYWLGGRLADRSPDSGTLFQMCVWAGFMVGLLPVLARPVLRMTAGRLASLNAGLLAGPLAAVLLLLAAPVTLLGCVSPFAIRLLLSEPEQGGTTAGRVYAVSTLGSLVGTFLPVLVTIPNLGTRATFFIFSGVLMLVSWAGLIFSRGRRALLYLVLLLVICVLGWATSAGVVKADAALVFETESAYNYIQVLRWGPGVQLKLNEGYGVQSVYNPEGALVGGIWDYFLIAPFFGPAPKEVGDVGSLCLIGLATGTVSKLYTRAFGPIPIDGVELDPAIISVGQRYFAMDEPNLQAVAADGRAFLTALPQERRYDVIAVDAYRPPYIPFHLSTREFFQSAREHLSENGVVAVNAARVQDDDRLVDALAATMQTVFPSVFVVQEPDEGFTTGNSLVVGTAQPSSLADWRQNTEGLEQALLAEMARRAAPHVRELAYDVDAVVLTDDRAPVEQIIHSIVLRYLTGPDS